jgi:hypothetical protein
VTLDREGVSIAAHVRTEGGHMSEGQAKIDALRSAGYQISPDLPEPYERVLKGLSKGELNALIKVKRDLEAAQSEVGPNEGLYTAYILPF